jgi:hypothetical protein
MYVKIKISTNPKFYFEITSFSSMKIFMNDNNFLLDKKNIEQNNTEHGSTLPDINELYKIEEINFNDPQQKYDLDEIFFSIADNFKTEYMEEGYEILNKIKKNNKPILNCFHKAKKIGIASKNGIVLYFDDDLDAELLNISFSKQEFIDEITNIVGRPIIIIGFEKKKFNILKDKYKESANNVEKKRDVDVEKIIKFKENSLFERAKKILS